MLLEAATWGGSMIGPILGGKIALLFGLRAPFACAFVLLCVAFVMLLLGYKETLDDTQRVDFTWARANPLGQLWPLLEHPVMVRFAIILGPTYLFAVVATQNVSSLYVAPFLCSHTVYLHDVLVCDQLQAACSSDRFDQHRCIEISATLCNSTSLGRMRFKTVTVFYFSLPATRICNIYTARCTMSGT